MNIFPETFKYARQKIVQNLVINVLFPPKKALKAALVNQINDLPKFQWQFKKTYH